MSGEITSPNMSLPVPGVGVTTGPVYATDVNNCLNIIDGHTHAAGSGVQITPSGLNINADLTFANNNAIDLRTVRFTAQSAPLALASDLVCLYGVNADLYFNDGVGNQIRITQAGSVAGASGTITGLPSGTASASYNAGSGTFTFQSATNTAATLDVGTVIIRNLTPSASGVSLEAPAALGADYTLVLPAIPASQKIMTLDASGNMSAPYVVDNSTIEINSNTIRVKALGITSAQIANGTITTTQISGTAGITGSQIAATTISNTNIINSTISGAKLVSNIDLDGAPTTNTKFLIASSVNSANPLSIVRGVVELAGLATPAVLTGEGFTVAPNNINTTLLVTYTNAFADIPSVQVTIGNAGGGAAAPQVIVSSTTGCEILPGTGAALFSRLNIFVIGQRT